MSTPVFTIHQSLVTSHQSLNSRWPTKTLLENLFFMAFCLWTQAIEVAGRLYVTWVTRGIRLRKAVLRLEAFAVLRLGRWEMAIGNI
jgi:hypothetical protein